MTDLQNSMLQVESENTAIENAQIADSNNNGESFRIDSLSPDQLIRFDSAVLGLVEYIMSRQNEKPIS